MIEKLDTLLAEQQKKLQRKGFIERNRKLVAVIFFLLAVVIIGAKLYVLYVLPNIFLKLSQPIQ